jgi:hypothetical protein
MYLSERIEREKITIRCVKLPDDPAFPNSYRVTVQRATGGTKVTIPRFVMGSYNFREPFVTEVINVLYPDITDAANYPVFEDWAQNYGYDPDSRKAYQIHKDLLRRARQVKKFLGTAYETWLNDTDNDT